MRKGRIFVVVCSAALVVALLPGSARSSTSITGTVTTLADGTAIPGAVVTVAGPDQPPVTDTTGSGGTFSVPITGAGPFSVGAQATGFRGQSVAGVPGGTVDFVLDASSLTPLPVFAGSIDQLVPDARSGVFYALNGGTDLYRTTDYGGTWRLVTMSFDDPVNGLACCNLAVATSAVPGEVAVFTAGFDAFGPTPHQRVYVSTDYGLTWRGMEVSPLIPGPSGYNDPTPPVLAWVHRGVVDVLVVANRGQDGHWHLARADLTAGTPAFVDYGADPFLPGSVVDIADSTNGGFVGMVNTSGALSFAPLTATDPIAFAAPVATGLPTAPFSLRLGGAIEASGPPDGALVVGGSGSPYDAVMFTKSTPNFDGSSLRSTATALPATPPTNCIAQSDARTRGSVAPTSTGTTGAGNVASCWVQTNGDGADLTITYLNAPGFGADIAYDASWGNGNSVAFTWGGGGWFKSASVDGNGVPVFDTQHEADPGTDPSSDGISRNGITSANTDDTAYGPASANELAVASGTGLTLASKDGGATFTEVLPVSFGSTNTDWWQGTSNQWLLFGNAGGGSTTMLTGFVDWNGQTAGSPNVGNSTATDLCGAPCGVTSLKGVPGADTLFMGLGAGNLVRAAISGNPPSLSALFHIDSFMPGGSTLYPPNALVYCPPDAPDADMQDVLLVATGNPGYGGTDPALVKGAFLRITGASTGSPSITVIGSIPHDTEGQWLTDVRADCTTGTVYVGGWPDTGLGLWKSTDAGMTFTKLFVPNIGPVSAVGLNPSDPNDVKVGDPRGNILESTDGGVNWTLITDPVHLRQASVGDIEYPPATGATFLAATAAASTTPTAAVGTGDGVFTGDLAAKAGVMSVEKYAGAGWLGRQITSLGTDDTPAMAVNTSTGAYFAVFHRTNGLWYTSFTSGSWSLPILIPGTKAGDEEPSLARDALGRLQLAFRRPTGTTPGIYVATRGTTGAWTAPHRVSALPGDAQPSIAVTGPTTPRTHVAFLRPGGSSPGVYYVSNRTGSWTTAGKVPGTNAADAKSAFGGPSLASDSLGRLHLAFARASGTPGIYYDLRSSTGWGALKRLTSVAGDAQPSLVVDGNRVNHIVFRRPGGTGTKGLFIANGATTWSVSHLPGTIAADTEPALTLNGTTYRLAFVRPTGLKPGIYYDAKVGTGSWLALPQRRSANALDTNPAIRADATGRITILFERG